MAFLYCTSLTSITIPASVTSIGSDVFYCWWSSSLTSITYVGTTAQWEAIEKGANWDGGYDYTLTCLGDATDTPDTTDTTDTPDTPDTPAAPTPTEGLDYILSSDNSSYHVIYSGNCTATEIVIPSTYNGLPVTGIVDEAFLGSSITSITIPASVTRIDTLALTGCTKLSSITIDSANPVYHSAGNCIIETATKILIIGCNTSVIPDDGSVEIIGGNAFSSAVELTSVIIPEGVTEIEWYAFSDCTSLSSITIPNSVTAIQALAICFSSNLTEVTYNGTMEEWEAIEKEDEWLYDTGEYTVHCTDGDIYI
jgi:hypothetical protein